MVRARIYYLRVPGSQVEIPLIRQAVAAKEKADAAARAKAGMAPFRIGGKIHAPKKIKDVKPVYPAIAQSARVAGPVTIEATIGPDGKVVDAWPYSRRTASILAGARALTKTSREDPAEESPTRH